MPDPLVYAGQKGVRDRAIHDLPRPNPVCEREGAIVKEQLGKVKAALGWMTGDRRVEAEGRAEEDAADPAKPTDAATEEVVDEREREVRKEHGDIRPRSNP
jgi:uncharacterized protein YjbJ (UPF0337 family)